MGCDGGTIPKRDELVRTKKKPEQKDKHSELSFRWGHCSITQEPLQKPIVACQLGRLYSKVAVIEGILDKSTLPEGCSHIKGIKDVKELTLSDNPAYQNKAKTGDSYDDMVAPYICPVIGLEMNGKFRFVYLWACGCVMSEKALKAMTGNSAKVCHKCQKPYVADDVIVLNGNEDDIASMQGKMEARQVKAKAEKKAKKGLAEKELTLAASGASASQPGTSKDSLVVAGTSKPPKHAVKRPHISRIEDPVYKKTKSAYSVAKDPKATEVFKSLFTSHSSATQQNKAHWITYNPFYN